MSKKNFKGGLNTLLGEAPNKKADKQKIKDKPLRGNKPGKVGRPATQFKEITKSSQEGTKENETRATFIVNEDLLEKLKAIAYWDRVMIKEVINTALQDTVAKYEKKNGKIKPVSKGTPKREPTIEEIEKDVKEWRSLISDPYSSPEEKVIYKQELAKSERELKRKKSQTKK